MALRVLLADESTTIKKVMQLALQDFAVEVKAVHVGVDVVEVAKSFEPDIIFVDVLLQKRNGYEVSAEIKREHRLSDIPVVLMWSSFMDLDEGQADQSGADRRLEKPFDVENLRQIVLELVPKTRSQRLAHFLKFPDSFAEPLRKEEKTKEKQAEKQPEPVRATPPPTAAPSSARPAQPSPSSSATATKTPTRDVEATKPPPLPPREEPKPFRGLKPQDKVEQEKPQRREPEDPATSANWNMESFDDIGRFHEEAEANSAQDDDADANDDEGFEQFRITPPARTTAKPMGRSLTKPSMARDPQKDADEDGDESANEPAATDDRDPWSHQDLSRFKLDLPPVSVENEDIEIDLDIPERDQPSKDFLMRKPAGVQKNQAKPASRDEGTKTGFTNKMQRPPLALDDYSSINAKPVPSARDEKIDDDFGQEVDLEFDTEERSKKPQLRRSIDDDIPSFGTDDLPAASLELEAEDLEDEVSAPVDTDYRRSAKPMAEQSGSREQRGSTSTGSQRRAPVPSLGDDDTDDLAIGGAVPQLSPERLEEIIRAQSREIIEAVVRRVVPDLATDMIREELQRLLEDTGGGSRGDARRDRQR